MPPEPAINALMAREDVIGIGRSAGAANGIFSASRPVWRITC